MSYKAQHDELRTRFNNQLATIGLTSAQVEWPNVTFTPTQGTLWVRFSILDGEALQTSIGAATNNHRHTGLVVVQVFAPQNAGDGAALVIADAIAVAFRNWCGTTVRCRAAAVKIVGQAEGWFQVNVSIPFQRDELL